MWYVKIGCAAANFDRGLQNDNSCRAVNIVVAINQNRLLALDGGFNPINSRPHASHQVRRMEVRD